MSKHAYPAWAGRPTLGVRIAKGIALAVIVSLVLFPMWAVVATSLADPQEIINNGGWVIWPERLSVQAYSEILDGGIVTRALLVSAGITTAGTALSLVCTIGLAYALSRPRLYGGKPILLLVLFTFLFPPGMVPLFLVVSELGLFDQYAALVLPFLINVFNLVVMRGFFQSIPEELLEAARLDGAGEFAMLRRIVLPLSKAVVAVVGLFYAVAYWNRFFEAIIYFNDQTKWPIGTVLRQYVTGGAALAEGEAGASSPQSVQMAVVVLATLPIVCVYPFLQRYFAKGVLTGALKA
ncbi:putative aldouronate transport system permease protein [Actinoplanes lutulentus]|uniref:Putative aldouronate transport system permease protein n=1 Tax=Actinoplanes lutulentus TaxID=1287878 RepID=A0A327ZA79_9ACTN|nr:carbohydrate ABC transporter permease [Actinoplanes lutulentus]MBB2947292.1 putative aldouronate transport system permease protein [Actinoplanes lutulentus]RAK36567.1 putative aldouronate transport system permease protein [Actinoplanes lutulentus]